MVVSSAEEYEARAIEYATTLRYDAAKEGSGPLYELRRKLFYNRDESALFDTHQWVRNAEAAYEEMWRRYVEGTEFEEGSHSPSIRVTELNAKRTRTS
jgi:protein O-GlcNAc transferase